MEDSQIAVILQSDVSGIDSFRRFQAIMHLALGHSLSFLAQMLDYDQILHPYIAGIPQDYYFTRYKAKNVDIQNVAYVTLLNYGSRGDF